MTTKYVTEKMVELVDSHSERLPDQLYKELLETISDIRKERKQFFKVGLTTITVMGFFTQRDEDEDDDVVLERTSEEYLMILEPYTSEKVCSCYRAFETYRKGLIPVDSEGKPLWWTGVIIGGHGDEPNKQIINVVTSIESIEV